MYIPRSTNEYESSILKDLYTPISQYMIEIGSIVIQARLRALMAIDAGAWLQYTSSPIRDILISNDEFSNIDNMRFGFDIFGEGEN